MTLPAKAASPPPPVQSEEFQGPLDLLLEEVHRQNVALENISMAPIVARFLEYVGSAAGRNLNLDIEWLHMAATLIHWKSRSLLPPDAGGSPQKDPVRDDLVQQLLAHRKQAADELARRRAIEDTRFSRAVTEAEPGGTKPATDEPEESAFVSVWDLIQQARELARWVEQHRRDRRRWRESFGVEQDDATVGEMMDYLRDQLAAREGILDAVGLLHSQATASRRACLFLGMLEMARNQQLEIQQEQMFGPIRLLRTEPRANTITAADANGMPTR
jgi:segregation and condensation protein A